MKFQYSLLSPTQFETLVIHLCYQLLGIGTESFSDGVDGGRDSRFDGVAEIYPSKSSPWSGLTVIQAKHTLSFNKKFSDPDFFGNASSDIYCEIPKIKKMIDEDGLENYFLFSNRKLPAKANEQIKNFISDQTGLGKSHIGLVGVEQLENYWKHFPYIPSAVGLNPFDMPLNVEPDELAEVIVALQKGLSGLTKSAISTKIARTGFDKKNEINNLDANYALVIKRKIVELYQVEEFLAMPENEELQRLYIESSEELAAKIAVFKADGMRFDVILEKTIELLLERDSELKANKAITRLMVYYMYYHCDIGEDDASAA